VQRCGPRCARRTVQDRVEDDTWRLARVGLMPGCHFVQHEAERKQIGPRVRLLAAHLLR
jgi:hypothetical protein